MPLFSTISNPCRWTRNRLPLLAGDDLATAERRRVERHLIGCPACRARSASFAEVVGVLHASASAPMHQGSESAPSLWPSLERQIRRSRHEPAPSFARLGLLAASVVVLGLGSLAFVTLSRPVAGPVDLQAEAAIPPRPALPKESPSTIAANAKPATPGRSGSEIDVTRPATSRGLDPQRSY